MDLETLRIALVNQGVEVARTPDESQYPDLWEGLYDQGGVWHKVGDKWGLI